MNAAIPSPSTLTAIAGDLLGLVRLALGIVGFGAFLACVGVGVFVWSAL